MAAGEPTHAAEQRESAHALRVADLAVGYRTRDQLVEAVRGVSLHVDKGEILGIVGESGCGKTTVASAIVGLLAGNAVLSRGSVTFDGQELLGAPARQLRKIRGRRLAFIPQNPMVSLNPVLTVGFQFVEAIRIHTDCGRRKASERAEHALSRVGIPDPQRVMRGYPHEFSGGTRQRILIAMALVHDPAVVIADEPTSALDATIQRQIVGLLSDLIRAQRMGLIIISHDLGVIAALADRVCVMYAGQVAEEGPVADVLARPRHPYTVALLEAASGRVPPLRARPAGDEPQPSCRFLPRCPAAMPVCTAEAPELFSARSHRTRCFLAAPGRASEPAGARPPEASC